MNRFVPSVVLLTTLCASAAIAGPDDSAAEAHKKLGETYASATPVDKLVAVAVASKDKVLNSKETAAAIAVVASAEVDKGKDAKERLELLGKLRAEAAAKLKELNKERKAQKLTFASFREPESYFQQAIALAYISSAAGAKPTLEKLGCLKLVRDCTMWSAHHKLILAVAEEAFARDEAFMKADFDGKLKIITEHSVTRGLLSDQERTYLEKAVLSEWMSAQLAAGKSADDLLKEVGKLKGEKVICFFTSGWAEGILKRVAAFPAKSGEK